VKTDQAITSEAEMACGPAAGAAKIGARRTHVERQVREHRCRGRVLDEFHVDRVCERSVRVSIPTEIPKNEAGVT
jgi:hypothetical protein